MIITVPRQSSLSHYHCRLSGPKKGPKSPVSRSAESGKRLSGGPGNGPESPEIADLGDLPPLTPTCGLAKRGADKAG